MPRGIPSHSRNESRELKQGRFGFFLEESLLDEWRDYAAREREEMSEIARRAIMNEIRGGSQPGAESLRSAYLSRVPCGPWAEAVDSGSHFTISEDTADELEARGSDVWVRADGQSMEGAGIMDGVMVLMRPLPDGKLPRRGEIALVQVFLGEGDGEVSDCTLATIKRWNSSNTGNQLPSLLDGDDNPFELPENTVRAVPVAVARGVLGRL